MKKSEKSISKKQSLKTVALTILLSLLLMGLNSCNEIGDPVPFVDSIEFDYMTFVGDATVTSETYTYDVANNLTVEFFDAVENEATDRPLILLSPGGAWSKYSQMDKIKALAITLVKRGYAVGIVKYTLGETRNGQLYIQGVHDIKNAVRFFKSKHEDFRIDKSKVFTGGWSTGGHLAYHAAHLTEEDINGISQEYFMKVFKPVFDDMGLEGDLYTDESSDVRGTLVMYPYTFDLGITDQGESALMLMAHRAQHWGDGTPAWGEIYNGLAYNYGPDKMKERALEEGYILNQDLFFVEIPETKTKSDVHINAMPLETEYYNNIVDFFFTNLD